MELWRAVEGVLGYEVSNYGNVRELESKRVLNQYDCGGYCILSLKQGNKYKSFRVHRLVAQAFIPNPNNLPCVNHKDENKANNNVDNLEWCTYKYNNMYGTRLDKIRASNSRRGCPKDVRDKIRKSVTDKQGKRVARLDDSGNILQIYDSLTAAQNATGIYRQTIRKMCIKSESTASQKSNWKYV